MTKKQNAPVPTANTNLRPDLKLDWCSYEAAKFAVEHWHYSRCMPKGKCVKVGVWENEKFIGCVIFGLGANNNAGKPYNLMQTEICELTRIALNNHVSPVSRIIAISLKFLKKACPKLKLIVSYADPAQKHHGGVYQAANWVYVGSSRPQRAVRVEGVSVHKRVANLRYGTASPERIQQLTGRKVEYGPIEWKHTYLMPLDAEMKAKIEPLRKPYPKRAGSVDSLHVG